MDAIYIDFEKTKNADEPAILGILRDVKGSTTFEQVIVDDALRTARTARRYLRVASLDDTVTELLAYGVPIVAWSEFDLKVVSRSSALPEMKRDFKSRYENARVLARTWRTTVHPKFKIAKDGPHDTRHRLDRYARLAGYPGAAALSGAPAKWIAHVRSRINKKGSYRQVNEEAKRDWHRLLEYNEHDCRALRHVYLKARFELEKWRAYERTNYCVTEGLPRPICFRVDSTSARLNALLERLSATRWAFLTAWNPRSERLPRAENQRRQAELVTRLQRDGYTCLAGEGRGDNPSWPPEQSVLALGITRRAARKFGRDYGQLAIVTGHRGFAAKLVGCG